LENKYFRPILNTGNKPADALDLAGGWTWFDRVEVMIRGQEAQFIAASDLHSDIKSALTQPRPDLAGLSFTAPRVLGIVNVTPDSFSDGGLYADTFAAVAHAKALVDDGADALDIGGESTRPGAVTVPADQEAARVMPVIEQLLADGVTQLSVDTRKASVAQAALSAGAPLVNDVSALAYDPEMASTIAGHRAAVCLMHAQGSPADMQIDPQYQDVVLDVFDALSAAVNRATTAGIARSRILVDPGIGFGKTLEHNLALLRNLSLFHGLGCPILLGASRKRFIGTIAQAENAADRVSGSIAVALAGIAQGIQVVRVHDVAETVQAIALWSAAHGMRQSG